MFDVHSKSRPIASILPDVYILWSSICDAPIGWTFDRETALQIRDRSVVDAADAERMEYDVLFNRAGPNEIPLTREALARMYQSEEACLAFTMTPADVQIMTTNDVDGNMVWEPWAPGNAPREFSRNFYNHYRSGVLQVPVTDTSA